MSQQGTKASHSGGHTRSRQPTAHHHQAANAILTVNPRQIGGSSLGPSFHNLGVSWLFDVDESDPDAKAPLRRR